MVAKLIKLVQMNWCEYAICLTNYPPQLKILLPLMNCIVKEEVTKKIVAFLHNKKILENHFGLQTKEEKSPWENCTHGEESSYLNWRNFLAF